MFKFNILIIFLLLSYSSFSQTLTTETSLHTLSSSNITPFYFHSNQYGKYDYTGGFEGTLEGKCFLSWEKGKQFSIEAGVDGLAKDDLSKSYLHQAFVNVHYGAFEFKIGKEELWLSGLNEELSSGAFLFGNNHRPVPRIGLGIYEYTAVPFTKGHVEVKGFLHHGWVNDDRIGSLSEYENHPYSMAKDVQLHDKQAYLRYARGPIKPYLGMNHSALIGGKRLDVKTLDYTKIPIDYIATFFSKGSEKLGGGDATNAAGAHSGYWDMGMYIELRDWYLNLYLNKPFSDGSGLKIWKFRNKDRILGFQASSKRKSIISGFAYEYFKTDNQSGAGTPDPFIGGKIVAKRDPQDEELSHSEYIYKYFGESFPEMEYDEFSRYIRDNVNEGHQFGGRDDYYNNGAYYAGNSYYGRSMGTPYFYSKQQMSTFSEEFSAPHDLLFVNNRVKAHFFALKGWLMSNLSYNIKYSHTSNKGTYTGKYTGKYSWDLVEDYYFIDNKKENFLNIVFRYEPRFCKKCSAGLMVGKDWGEIYNATGIGFELSYRFSSSLK